MDFKVGTSYVTKGEWEAKVIWKNAEAQSLVVIHKPGTKEESGPICHRLDGKAVTTFSVCQPPDYGMGNVADLTEKVFIKNQSEVPF